MTYVFYILAEVFMILYFPIAVYSLYSMIQARKHRDDRTEKGISPGRRIVVSIVTNGQNPDVVEDIIMTLNTYKTEQEIYVLKEESDSYMYSTKQIVVPAGYKTLNGSKKKMRAMQYGIWYLHEIGYGKETYIVHLDDDSIVPESYIRYVESMEEDAGQGTIRLRGDGIHLMSTLTDMNRVSTCDIYCRRFNSREHPLFVHGEGLVIRADIEYEIGWDYGTYGAEDLIMGITIASKGYKFGYIPEHIYISPPTSTVDFYKQRRRWAYSIRDAGVNIWRINRKVLLFYVYGYLLQLGGMIGTTAGLIGIILGFMLAPFFFVLGIIDLVVVILIYEYGVFKTDKKYALWMLLLFFPIIFYEGLTLIYMIIKPPKKGSFDVIRKVRIR